MLTINQKKLPKGATLLGTILSSDNLVACAEVS